MVTTQNQQKRSLWLSNMHTTTLFSETKTKITNESHKYLRESVGTEKFKDIEEKVVEWINQFEVPSKIVVVKPPATY